MSTQKRGDTYYSRIVVPSTLRHIVPRREVVKSLHVQTYSAARLRCAEWEARVLGMLLKLEYRGQELSGPAFDAELNKLAGPQAGTTGNGEHCTSPHGLTTLIGHTILIGAAPALAAPQDPLLAVTAAYLREHSGSIFSYSFLYGADSASVYRVVSYQMIRFHRLNAVMSSGDKSNHSPSPRLSLNRLCQ